VKPSDQTISRLERFAEKTGIEYRFDPRGTSPGTSPLTGEIVFPGSSLADVPLVNIADEFGHAFLLKKGYPTIGTGRFTADNVLHHADIFGRASISSLLTASEQESLQAAEIYLREAMKRMR